MTSYWAVLRKFISLAWVMVVLAWAVFAHVHENRRRRRERREFRRYWERYA